MRRDMTIRVDSELFDRVVEDDKLPPAFADRVIALARARRRRKLASIAGVAAAFTLASAVVLPRMDLPGMDNDANVAATSTGVAEEIHRPAEAILAVKDAGNEKLVVVRRDANPDEAAGGGKAVEVFIASDGEPFYRATDYLLYDYTCASDEQLCTSIQPTGLGLYFVRVQHGGRKFVFVQTPADRKVSVLEGERQHSIGSADAGAVIEISASFPESELQVWVELPDGRKYRLVDEPGSTIDTQRPSLDIGG